MSAIAQGLVTRFGVRSVLPVGLGFSTVALLLFAQLPVDGHYFWDLFPGFIISGLGLAFVFIPMSIGALTGVRPADAGIASGLINTSQQIGGAIGVAAATTIATPPPAVGPGAFVDRAARIGSRRRRRGRDAAPRGV